MLACHFIYRRQGERGENTNYIQNLEFMGSIGQLRRIQKNRHDRSDL